MQPYQLRDIFHLVHGQGQTAENRRHHPRAYHVVAVERPPCGLVIALARRFADVVQKSRPTQPEQVVAAFLRGDILAADIVRHGKRVGEIVLMPPAVHGLDTLEGRQLRQYARQEFCRVKKMEGKGGTVGDQHLVKFLCNPLTGEYAEPVRHTAHRLHRLRHNPESQILGRELRREAHSTQHTQRVIRIGRVGIQRCADNAGCKVAYPAERVYQRAEIVFLQRKRHRIDGEIPPHLVILYGSVLDYRLARFPPVGFLAGADKLNLVAFEAEHRGPEVLEIRDSLVETLADSLGEIDSASLHHHINIIARTAQKAVPDISTYHEGSHLPFSRDLPQNPENRLFQKLRYN